MCPDLFFWKEEIIMVQQFFVGITLSLAIGWGGYKKRALSASGALGATLIGTAIFAFGGWQWGVLLVLFFASSSGFSFFKETEKQTVSEKFEKGHRRDIWQTLANGGMGALCAVMTVVIPSPLWGVAFVGALATVTADTWATELGVLSRQLPRLITSGKKVAPGFSGGITALGTAAAFLGALSIGIAAPALSIVSAPSVVAGATFALLFAVAGLAGAVIDSILGATVQILYRCPVCASVTEQMVHHRCADAPTEYVRGIRWMNNDVVNFISSLVGAGIATVLLYRFVM